MATFLLMPFPASKKETRSVSKLRLSPGSRKKMIEEVLIGGKRVSEVCRRYNLSRKTFYQWKARYEKAKEKGESLFQAMEDCYLRDVEEW